MITHLSAFRRITLGPDTGDLNMRMGLHSGPVTAGVLRGEKSRFQLFGDTVNTGKLGPWQRSHSCKQIFQYPQY